MAELRVGLQDHAAALALSQVGPRWITSQEKHISTCDGKNASGVRTWIIEIRRAAERVPQGLNGDALMHELIGETARGDLYQEIEQFLHAQQQRAQTTYGAILDHLTQVFLGPDEEERLKKSVTHVKQGSRESLANYIRRFKRVVVQAFPLPWNAETDRKLAQTFMASLIHGKAKETAFFHQPRLVTLQAACAVAQETETALNWKASCDKGEQPMEIDAVLGEVAAATTSQDPSRELLIAIHKNTQIISADVSDLKQRVTDLEQDRKKPQSTNAPPKARAPASSRRPAPHAARTAPGSRRTPDFSQLECYQCHQLGHPQRLCTNVVPRGPTRAQRQSYNPGE